MPPGAVRAATAYAFAARPILALALLHRAPCCCPAHCAPSAHSHHSVVTVVVDNMAVCACALPFVRVSGRQLFIGAGHITTPAQLDDEEEVRAAGGGWRS